jgi:hypothetical protein
MLYHVNLLPEIALAMAVARGEKLYRLKWDSYSHALEMGS